jgi:hypothetical protein
MCYDKREKERRAKKGKKKGKKKAKSWGGKLTFLVNAEGFSINTSFGMVLLFRQASINDTLLLDDSPSKSTPGIVRISMWSYDFFFKIIDTLSIRKKLYSIRDKDTICALRSN